MKNPKASGRQFPHHIRNTADFVQQLKGITLKAYEAMVSYDVSALFTSVLIDPAINIIRRKLELDQVLHLRTSMSVEQIISLLEFCLKTTYFQFQVRFFEQLQGAAMGSPISSNVANLYMEDFENKAINTAKCPPKFGRGMWMTLFWSLRLIRSKVSWTTSTV